MGRGRCSTQPTMRTTLITEVMTQGIEPESVVIGTVKGRTYAFVGLERDSSIVVFDLSDPTAPTFVTYVTNRRFPTEPGDNFDCLPEDDEDNTWRLSTSVAISPPRA